MHFEPTESVFHSLLIIKTEMVGPPTRALVYAIDFDDDRILRHGISFQLSKESGFSSSKVLATPGQLEV